MHQEKIFFIHPEETAIQSPSTPTEQLQKCLSEIKRILVSVGLETQHILKQTIFIDAQDNGAFFHYSKEFFHIIKEFYGPQYPPTGFIGEPPANGDTVAIEIILVSDKNADIIISHNDIEGIRYITLRSPRHKAIYAAGLTCSEKERQIQQQSQGAFDLMKRILDRENMDFSQVLRQWNYVENIVGETNIDGTPRQNYQVFNDIRSQYYSSTRWTHGYPAATGIGMDCGGIVLQFIAMDVSAHHTHIPVKNPIQVDAHCYTQDVLVGTTGFGLTEKTTPKFERAKAVVTADASTIYISGTAAIQGQETLAIGDVAEQTRITCDNILRLVSPDNLRDHGINIPDALQTFSHIRVYIKKQTDRDIVRNVCRDYFKDIPSLYLVSDVCRHDLLVEIEGGMTVSKEK